MNRHSEVRYKIATKDEFSNTEDYCLYLLLLLKFSVLSFLIRTRLICNLKEEILTF